MLLLSTFEQEIDSDILKRGLDYYKRHAVLKLKQKGDKVWQAKVQGSEVYKVQIGISEDKVEACECTCPYDLGSYCKHLVAVMYALRDENNIKSKKSIKAEDDLPIDKILSQLDKQTLIQIISDQADEDPEFQSSLIANYTPSSNNLTKDHYNKLIREALQTGKDRYGFIDYWAAGRVMRSVYDLLDRAQELLDQKKPKHAIPIAQAALEVLVPVLQQADDSNGEIGGGIDQALQILSDSVPTLSTGDKEQFFEYLLQESQHKRYQGWDFHWQLLEIAASLVASDTQQEKLFKVIDKLTSKKKEDYIGEYDAERGAKIKLSVYEQKGDIEAFESFLKNNLDLHDLRKIAIERAIMQNNLQFAQQLANEGVDRSKTKWPGLVDDYREYLLDIAHKQNDHQAINLLAEELFLSSADLSFYKIIKEISPADKWRDRVKEIVKKIEKGEGHHAGSWTAAEICAKEGLIEDLWRVVSKDKSVHLAEKYQEQLRSDYSGQLASLYGSGPLHSKGLKNVVW